MTRNTFKLCLLAASLAGAVGLTACGGSSSGDPLASATGYSAVKLSIASPGTAINNAGNSVSVMGTANTPNTVIKTVTWSVSPSATLTNSDCAGATKTSQTYAANAQNGTGTSTWSCAVGITAPTSITVNTDYTLTMTAVDDKGNSQSTSQVVSFVPTAGGTGAASNGLTANAGSDFTANSGSSNALHCAATGGTAPYSYQWLISNSGGYNFTLGTYSAADTTFTAPAVSASTVLTFTCRATDAANFVSTSTVNATINPASAATAQGNLVASVAQPATASPGQVITLDGTKTGWFNSTGASISGPTPSFTWTSTDAGVVLGSPNAISTTATIPTGITSATNIGFTLTATSGTSTSSSNVAVLVDPYGPLSLTVAPPTTVSKGNLAVSITANATNASSSAQQIFYKWSQVSGPVNPVTMGGGTTKTMGFTPDVVASGSATYVFRVAIGYQPITATYPGLYFADATVTVVP